MPPSARSSAPALVGTAEPDPVTILAMLPDPVVVVSPTGHLVWGNARAEEAFGLDLHETRGTHVADLLHPDDLVSAAASLDSVQGKALGTPLEIRLRSPEGQWVRYEARGWSGVHDPRVGGVVVALRRTEDRGRWSVARGDRDRLAAVLDWSGGLTLLLDQGGRLLAANRAFTTNLGRDVAGALGQPLHALVVPEHAATVASVVASLSGSGGSRSFEATLRAEPPRPHRPFGFTAVDLLDDAEVGAIVVSGVDVAALVEARAELAHRATHDHLTGLANRVLVLERLDLALRSRAEGDVVGLVYCDVDAFKGINDTWGHTVGDEVLVAVAERVAAVVRPSDTVGRIGGDEIVVVVSRASIEEVQRVAAEITRVTAEPIPTSAGLISLTVSTGVAGATCATRADELLDRADRAMYARKRSRRGAPG